MKTTVSALSGVDLADLPPFFDIVNGFFNRCRGDMADPMGWFMLLQIKLIIWLR
jgi:hypothetical protein